MLHRVRPLIYSSFFAALFTTALLAINIASASIDRSAIKAKVEAAFQTNQLMASDYYRTDGVLGNHQFNDCLILDMVMNDDRPAIERGLSPTYTHSGIDKCETLRKTIAGEQLDVEPENTSYHRYLHGHTALAAVMLSVMPLHTARLFLSLSQIAILIATVCVSCRLYLNAANPTERSISITTGWASLCLILFFGFSFFSMSLSHGPADSLLGLYLLCWLIFKPWRMSVLSTTIFHGVFGALTAYFEFLTGGIPMGMCLVFLCYAGIAASDKSRSTIADGFMSVAAFCAGIVVAFVVKLAATTLAFGPEVIGDFTQRLSYRTLGGEDGGTYPWNAAWAVLKGSYTIGHGSTILGGILILSASGLIASCLWGLRTKSVREISDRTLLLLLSAASIYVWWIVFSQHTAQHYFFMARIAVGTIIAAPLLAYSVVENRPKISRG